MSFTCDNRPSAETRPSSGLAGMVTASQEEFDRFVTDALPALLDRATGLTRRFLRETGQWADDTSHEKLAIRWGYEMVERFAVCGRTEAPCRPVLLLDSFVAKHLSQPDALYYRKDLMTPLGHFLDALLSRAVLSRDALVALFYHLYGFSQGQVVKLLGLGHGESQRVYKNFDRWRESGWQRVMEETGVTDEEIDELEQQRQQASERLNHEASRLLRSLQAHFRKSDPDHYPCLARMQWERLFSEGYGFDYRTWHLPFCQDCCFQVCALRAEELHWREKPRVDLHIRPLSKGRPFGLVGIGARSEHQHA